jgi:hypothetical protein
MLSQINNYATDCWLCGWKDLVSSFRGLHGCWSVDIKIDKLKATKFANYASVLKICWQAGTKSGAFRSRPAETIIIAGCQRIFEYVKNLYQAVASKRLKGICKNFQNLF